MNTEEKVIEIIAEFLDIDKGEITGTSDLREDLNADSLDFAELVMEIEEEFDIEAPEEKLAKIKTVGDIAKFVDEVK